MGGAFSFAQGAAARGDPAAAPLSFFARTHERLLGGAPAAQAYFPCHGRAYFFLCAAVLALPKMAFSASCMSRS